MMELGFIVCGESGCGIVMDFGGLSLDLIVLKIVFGENVDEFWLHNCYGY